MIPERSRELMQRARRVMPGGVSSPVRAFRAVGGDPLFIASAQGSHLTDVDGRRYLDYVCSWGPLILGHAHPQVVEAVRQAARLGTSYGAPQERELELAEAVCRRMPWVEMVRFVNSGTEATMSALRLARAATGRGRVLKFAGNYHGHVDSLLVKAGSGVATLGLPDSPGITPETARLTLVAPYNDLEAVERLFSSHPGEIAAVIVEPVAGNMGVVPPQEGFLQGLATLARQHGTLLILDEVITGFRVAPGGAADLYRLEPDLVCLGKIIGGGLPVGAYGGRRDLMRQMAPVGPVYQAGTLSGNPLAMAAGLATLELLDASIYARLEEHSALLEQGLGQALSAVGQPGSVHRVGSLLGVFFTDQEVKDAESALSTNRELYARLFRGMLERGIYLAPSALEAWFVSAAHSREEILQTVEVFEQALRAAL